MADLVYKNPQVARRWKPWVEPIHEKKSNDDDVIYYERRQVIRKIGEGEEDFVIEEKPVVSLKVNRQAYISKDADDVGVLNILKKVRLSGDASLLDQTGARYTDALQDYTDIPGDVGEALKAIQKGATSFEGMKAILGDVTFEELANMSPEDLTKRFNDYISSVNGEKKGEEE